MLWDVLTEADFASADEGTTGEDTSFSGAPFSLSASLIAGLKDCFYLLLVCSDNCFPLQRCYAKFEACYECRGLQDELLS